MEWKSSRPKIDYYDDGIDILERWFILKFYQSMNN